MVRLVVRYCNFCSPFSASKSKALEWQIRAGLLACFFLLAFLLSFLKLASMAFYCVFYPPVTFYSLVQGFIGGVHGLRAVKEEAVAGRQPVLELLSYLLV